MEIFLGSLLLIGSLTAILAIDEFINWMNDYNRLGEADREYQRQKTDKSYGIEYRE